MSKSSKLNEENKLDTNDDMIDWWAGTVILTFLPMLISIVISICRGGFENINRAIGDGELILSAFLVTIPSIMDYCKSGFMRKSREHKKLCYLLALVAILELTAYVTIKTNSTNKPSMVYITSVLCTVSSVIISWKSESFLKW